jgi:hypothetical protein
MAPGQRVKRANVVEAADERDSSISIAMRFLDGAAQALELVEPSQAIADGPYLARGEKIS